MSYWMVEGVWRRRDAPTFAERFDEFDERLENAMRLEGGRRQSD